MLLRMEGYQVQPIEFYGNAARGSYGLEFITGFVCALPGDDDTSLFDALRSLLPEHLAGAPGDVSDVDAGTDLQ